MYHFRHRRWSSYAHYVLLLEQKAIDLGTPMPRHVFCSNEDKPITDVKRTWISVCQGSRDWPS